MRENLLWQVCFSLSQSPVSCVCAHGFPKRSTCNVISWLLSLKEGLLGYKVNCSQLCGHGKHKSMSASIISHPKKAKVTLGAAHGGLLRLGPWSSREALSLESTVEPMTLRRSYSPLQQ